MAKIYLVRHAESIANTQGIYQGQTYDTPLSSLGRLQAKALAKCSMNLNLEHIIASPLRRTRETASYVSEVHRISVEYEPRITETNHGCWEGKHKAVIAKNWSDTYRKWMRFPSRVQFPDGEHFLDTKERVIDWWEGLVNSKRGDALVVTHDNIVRIIIARILNMKLNRMWKFHLHPAALTTVEVVNGCSYIKIINEGAHLQAVRTDVAVHAL